MALALQVHPLDTYALVEQAAALDLPLWATWPPPAGWLVTGHGHVGDVGRYAGRPRTSATVFASSGPNPLGGNADLLVVAEEPGTGLGSRLAGLATTDPGPGFDHGPPHARALVGGHPTSLWSVRSSAADSAVYAGEAAGLWLWLVLHPEAAGVLLMETLHLVDVRELGHEVHMLAYGQRSPRLDLT